MKDVKELRKEGASRMRALGMTKSVAREFEKSGTLYYSEKVGFPGVLYRAGNDERLERKVGEFEKEFGVSVYHVVLTNCEFGRVYSFPYVGDEEDGGGKKARSEFIEAVTDGKHENECECCISLLGDVLPCDSGADELDEFFDAMSDDEKKRFDAFCESIGKTRRFIFGGLC